MTKKREVKSKELIMGKLAHGTDLLQELGEVECEADSQGVNWYRNCQ